LPSCPPQGYFLFQLAPTTVKNILYKACDYSLPAGGTLVCFDGAALPNGICCGAGGTFKYQSSRTTKWFLNCGVGSNNKAELMGLWASLFLASCWSLNHLRVLGDSRVVIDWINHKHKLQSVHFEGWKQQTLELAKLFSDIQFHHFHRHHNTEADALSKRALCEVAGRLSIFHCDNGIESPHTTINLFES
jgi:ribonuclease HI